MTAGLRPRLCCWDSILCARAELKYRQRGWEPAWKTADDFAPDPGGRARWWTGQTRHLGTQDWGTPFSVSIKVSPDFASPGRRGTSLNVYGRLEWRSGLWRGDLNLRRKEREGMEEREGKRWRDWDSAESWKQHQASCSFFWVLIPKLEQLSSERIKDSQENQGTKRQRLKKMHSNFSALMCIFPRLDWSGGRAFHVLPGEKLPLRIRGCWSLIMDPCCLLKLGQWMVLGPVSEHSEPRWESSQLCPVIMSSYWRHTENFTLKAAGSEIRNRSAARLASCLGVPGFSQPVFVDQWLAGCLPTPPPPPFFKFIYSASWQSHFENFFFFFG